MPKYEYRAPPPSYQALQKFHIHITQKDISYYECLKYRKYRMTISSTKTKSMAMRGNHIQRVKIVINNNIIEQVTYFKYLGTVYQNTKAI